MHICVCVCEESARLCVRGEKVGSRGVEGKGKKDSRDRHPMPMLMYVCMYVHHEHDLRIVCMFYSRDIRQMRAQGILVEKRRGSGRWIGFSLLFAFSISTSLHFVLSLPHLVSTSSRLVFASYIRPLPLPSPLSSLKNSPPPSTRAPHPLYRPNPNHPFFALGLSSSTFSSLTSLTSSITSSFTTSFRPGYST